MVFRSILRKFNRPILWLVTLLHFFWGSALIIAPDVVKRTTALAPMSRFPAVAGLIFLASATIATMALVHEMQGRPVSPWTFWALMPQQTLLMISASSVLYYVIEGHYASGTQLPSLFILTDQVAKILLAALHPLGVFRMHLPILPNEKTTYAPE